MNNEVIEALNCKFVKYIDIVSFSENINDNLTLTFEEGQFNKLGALPSNILGFRIYYRLIVTIESGGKSLEFDSSLFKEKRFAEGEDYKNLSAQKLRAYILKCFDSIKPPKLNSLNFNQYSSHVEKFYSTYYPEAECEKIIVVPSANMCKLLYDKKAKKIETESFLCIDAVIDDKSYRLVTKAQDVQKYYIGEPIELKNSIGVRAMDGEVFKFVNPDDVIISPNQIDDDGKLIL